MVKSQERSERSISIDALPSKGSTRIDSISEHSNLVSIYFPEFHTLVVKKSMDSTEFNFIENIILQQLEDGRIKPGEIDGTQVVILEARP